MAAFSLMNRREEWRKVLEAEVRRWSAMPYERLASELRDDVWYEVELDGVTHQVEVELIENTGQYLHVVVAVDDGTLPESIRPECQSIIRRLTTSSPDTDTAPGACRPA